MKPLPNSSALMQLDMQRINFQIHHSVRNLILRNLNLDYLFKIIFFENNSLYGIV